MRRLVTAGRIREFLRRLGSATSEPTDAYLTGGATAVLMGWRESTVDLDLKLVPDTDDLLRHIPSLKEELSMNVELASPDLFLPVPDSWRDRSIWEATEGQLTVRHFDLRAQALAKLLRGHDRDMGDVDEMMQRGLVNVDDLWSTFEEIEPHLFRFPSIDLDSFRSAVIRAAERYR